MVKKTDIILIIIITLFSIAFIFIFQLSEKRRPAGAFVTATVDGKTAKTVSLSENGRYKIQTGDFVNGFKVENGQAEMTEANCPDGLCIHQPSISRSGEMIVCLPHKLILEVGRGEEQDVDAVAK